MDLVKRSSNRYITLIFHSFYPSTIAITRAGAAPQFFKLIGKQEIENFFPNLWEKGRRRREGALYLNLVS